jgi:predicted transcriptional regulator
MSTAATHARPSGRLADGTPYHGRIGEMAYDDDRVQCHLCGKWFKWVGGAHLRQGHGWSLDEYREAFQLLRTTTTASPATSTLKRKRMFEQIAAGQRVPPDHEEAKRRRAKQDPTVARWRSLAAMRPDLAAELHPTRNGKLDPYALGRHSHRAVWWRGVDCGHEWQMSPNERTSAGRGCPTCGKGRSIAATIERNRQPIPPERSLAVRYPLLLAEWHPSRNGSLD